MRSWLRAACLALAATVCGLALGSCGKAPASQAGSSAPAEPNRVYTVAWTI